MPEINTPLARSFRKIVTAGWAQHSSGDVNSPTGHFAYIPIAPRELNELVAACLDDDDERPIESQYYVLVEDSDGNSCLYIYGSTREGLDHFNALQSEYENRMSKDECEVCESNGRTYDPDRHDSQNCWQREKQYLVHERGEAFDDMIVALDHTCNVDTDSHYQIKPESEAL